MHLSGSDRSIVLNHYGGPRQLRSEPHCNELTSWLAPLHIWRDSLLALLDILCFSPCYSRWSISGQLPFLWAQTPGNNSQTNITRQPGDISPNPHNAYVLERLASTGMPCYVHPLPVTPCATGRGHSRLTQLNGQCVQREDGWGALFRREVITNWTIWMECALCCNIWTSVHIRNELPEEATKTDIV